MEWTFVGRIENGNAVYLSANKEIAVERDHTYLVEPRPFEEEWIYRKWPNLRPKEELDKNKITSRYDAGDCPGRH